MVNQYGRGTQVCSVEEVWFKADAVILTTAHHRWHFGSEHDKHVCLAGSSTVPVHCWHEPGPLHALQPLSQGTLLWRETCCVVGGSVASR